MYAKRTYFLSFYCRLHLNLTTLKGITVDWFCSKHERIDYFISSKRSMQKIDNEEMRDSCFPPNLGLLAS